MSGDKKGCPVTNAGCPPVITLVADMKWVKRGAYAAIANAVAVIGTLTVVAILFFGRVVLNSLADDALANTPTEMVEGKTK